MQEPGTLPWVANEGSAVIAQLTRELAEQREANGKLRERIKVDDLLKARVAEGLRSVQVKLANLPCLSAPPGHDLSPPNPLSIAKDVEVLAALLEPSKQFAPAENMAASLQLGSSSFDPFVTGRVLQQATHAPALSRLAESWNVHSPPTSTVGIPTSRLGDSQLPSQIFFEFSPSYSGIATTSASSFAARPTIQGGAAAVLPSACLSANPYFVQETLSDGALDNAAASPLLSVPTEPRHTASTSDPPSSLNSALHQLVPTSMLDKLGQEQGRTAHQHTRISDVGGGWPLTSTTAAAGHPRLESDRQNAFLVTAATFVPRFQVENSRVNNSRSGLSATQPTFQQLDGDAGNGIPKPPVRLGLGGRLGHSQSSHNISAYAGRGEWQSKDWQRPITSLPPVPVVSYADMKEPPRSHISEPTRHSSAPITIDMLKQFMNQWSLSVDDISNAYAPVSNKLGIPLPERRGRLSHGCSSNSLVLARGDCEDDEDEDEWDAYDDHSLAPDKELHDPKRQANADIILRHFAIPTPPQAETVPASILSSDSQKPAFDQQSLYDTRSNGWCPSETDSANSSSGPRELRAANGFSPSSTSHGGNMNHLSKRGRRRARKRALDRMLKLLNCVRY